LLRLRLFREELPQNRWSLLFDHDPRSLGWNDRGLCVQSHVV